MGEAQPIDVHLNGCNEMVCVGMLPVGPVMREQISQNATPAISYPTVDGKTITVTATLKGLTEALSPSNDRGSTMSQQDHRSCPRNAAAEPSRRIDD